MTSTHNPAAQSMAPDWSLNALSRIRFSRHPKGGFGLKINGYWVQENTLREAFALFWQGVHHLDRDRRHSAEDLACTPDWADRPDGQRKAMGRCFKYFALHGVLPIRLANPDAPYNFKYRLNDGLKPSPSNP